MLFIIGTLFALEKLYINPTGQKRCQSIEDNLLNHLNGLICKFQVPGSVNWDKEAGSNNAQYLNNALSYSHLCVC